MIFHEQFAFILITELYYDIDVDLSSNIYDIPQNDYNIITK